jgi:FecR protein
MIDDLNHDNLRTLADAAIEGAITTEQLATLESLILTNPSARRWYTEYVSLNASLEWAVATKTVTPAEPQRVEKRFLERHRLAVASLASVVCVVIGLLLAREPRSVAVLVETKACKWDAGTLPTEAGAQLRAGRLRLAEGLARIVFTSGVEVSLEAPADLEIMNSMRCTLHSGRVTANVPPRAKGFIIDTPTSRVTDFGTEFGVTVHNGNTADVMVFSGQVDVKHTATGLTEVMKTGSTKRFLQDRIEAFDPNHRFPQLVPAPMTDKHVQLTTAVGRGQDAFVMNKHEIPDDRRSETLLLVKSPHAKMPEWSRKAYLAFDLATIEPHKIATAELSLTFAPTGMGFAAQVPDATFAVYGLTDESLDAWDEATIRWVNAPANVPTADAVDPSKTTLLGRFTIAQGEQAGSRKLDDRAIANWLRRDTNKLVTIIVVRETRGLGTCDLVHGFASRRHPTLAPPTLRFTMQP